MLPEKLCTLLSLTLLYLQVLCSVIMLKNITIHLIALQKHAKEDFATEENFCLNCNVMAVVLD